MRNDPRILSYHMSMAASYWQERFEEGAQDAADIQEQFQDMMRGIQKYLAHDYVRGDGHLSHVYEDGAASLLQYDAHEYGDGKPVCYSFLLLLIRRIFLT